MPSATTAHQLHFFQHFWYPAILFCASMPNHSFRKGEFVFHDHLIKLAFELQSHKAQQQTFQRRPLHSIERSSFDDLVHAQYHALSSKAGGGTDVPSRQILRSHSERESAMCAGGVALRNALTKCKFQRRAGMTICQVDKRQPARQRTQLRTRTLASFACLPVAQLNEQRRDGAWHTSCDVCPRAAADFERLHVVTVRMKGRAVKLLDVAR